MKRSNDGNRKVLIASVLVFIVTCIITASLGALFPAVMNWFLQPWDWAKRQLFTGVLNVFHLSFFEGTVNWSTKNTDKFAYAIVQTCQCLGLVLNFFELYVSPENRKRLTILRVIAYLIEIPVNGLYNWNHYENEARINNPIQRWLTIVFITGIMTLALEGFLWVMLILYSLVVGIFRHNREQSTPSNTTYDTNAQGGRYP